MSLFFCCSPFLFSLTAYVLCPCDVYETTTDSRVCAFICFPPLFPGFLSAPTDTVEARIYDYLEVVMLFGFVSIFIISFPSSGLLPFCIIAWELEIVIDAIKLATGFRKPLPRRAEDIGVWEDVLNMMAGIAIVSNAYQVLYMAKFDYTLHFSLAGEAKSNTFWVICASALILRWITLRVMGGEPYHVKIQLERRGFLSDKLVMNRPDENFEVHTKKGEEGSKIETILKSFFPDSVEKPPASLFAEGMKGRVAVAGGGESKAEVVAKKKEEEEEEEEKEFGPNSPSVSSRVVEIEMV